MLRALPLLLVAALSLSACDTLKNIFGGNPSPKSVSQSYVATETALATAYVGISQYASLPDCPAADGALCRDQELLADIIVASSAANDAMDAWRQALACPDGGDTCTPDPDAVRLISTVAVGAVCDLKPLLVGNSIGGTVVSVAMNFCGG